MVQNSEFLCGLFCVRAELMITEGTIFRRPLNSTGSIFADGSSLTAAHYTAQSPADFSLYIGVGEEICLHAPSPLLTQVENNFKGKKAHKNLEIGQNHLLGIDINSMIRVLY